MDVAECAWTWLNVCVDASGLRLPQNHVPGSGTLLNAPQIDAVREELASFDVCGLYHQDPTSTKHCCLQEVLFYFDWLQRHFPQYVWPVESDRSVVPIHDRAPTQSCGVEGGARS